MLDQQAAIKLAEEEGRPIPTFKPVVPRAPDADTLVSESAKKKIEKKLEKLDGMEREAQQAAIDAERRANTEMVHQIQDLWKVQEEERKARMARGEGTMWDKVATTWNNLSSGSSKK